MLIDRLFISNTDSFDCFEVWHRESTRHWWTCHCARNHNNNGGSCRQLKTSIFITNEWSFSAECLSGRNLWVKFKKWVFNFFKFKKRINKIRVKTLNFQTRLPYPHTSPILPLFCWLTSGNKLNVTTISRLLSSIMRERVGKN
jgi:hypothetical protein